MIHSKEKIQLNLKKALWTISKIQKMIEDEKYCTDIAHQINATIWLLQSANRDLLKNHLATCWVEKLATTWEQKDIFIEELVKTWDLTTRK